MKVTWGRRTRGVEVVNTIGGIPQVGNGLPGVISFGPTLPVNKIL